MSMLCLPLCLPLSMLCLSLCLPFSMLRLQRKGYARRMPLCVLCMGFSSHEC